MFSVSNGPKDHDNEHEVFDSWRSAQPHQVIDVRESARPTYAIDDQQHAYHRNAQSAARPTVC